MNKAGRYDFELQQGASFAMSVYWLDSLKNPVNLTGMTAAMKIKKSKDDSAALLSLTSSPAAGLTINAGTGLVNVAITAGQAAALLYDLMYYDLVLTVTSTSVKTRLLEGTIVLNKSVT